MSARLAKTRLSLRGFVTTRSAIVFARGTEGFPLDARPTRKDLGPYCDKPISCCRASWGLSREGSFLYVCAAEEFLAHCEDHAGGDRILACKMNPSSRRLLEREVAVVSCVPPPVCRFEGPKLPPLETGRRKQRIARSLVESKHVTRVGMFCVERLLLTLVLSCLLTRGGVPRSSFFGLHRFVAKQIIHLLKVVWCVFRDPKMAKCCPDLIKQSFSARTPFKTNNLFV